MPELPTNRSSIWRWLPLGLLIVAMTAAYAAGIQNYLTFSAIAEHRGLLKGLVARNLVLAWRVKMKLHEIVTVAVDFDEAAGRHLGEHGVAVVLPDDVAVTEEGAASVTYTLTSMGCPVGPLFEKEIREAVESMEGITAVDTKMTMQPPWGPDKMSEFAKSALGFF